MIRPVFGLSDGIFSIDIENEAESRGLGGLPGAFAIATADRGTITFTRFENDTALNHVGVSLDLGADFAARYAADDPTSTFVNSDISPHFPYAARIWAAMWEKKSGEHVDGAIAIDPRALSYLLKVSGPARLPDGSRVDDRNVVRLTQQDEYAKFADDAERKAYLVALAKAAATKLTRGGDTTAMIRAIGKAARQRRILAWSADATLEKAIVAAGYGGVVQGGPGRFSGFVVVNAGGNKLDYYLERTMTYHSTGCGAGSQSVASFTMTNTAPRSGLPPYVTARLDRTPAGFRPGDNHLLVTYYASNAASIGVVALDGKPVTVASAPENGLNTVTLDVELPAGTARTMTVAIREPATKRPVQILAQPLVRTLHVDATGTRCG